MERILCPVDFSNASSVAVEYAARFAKIISAELTLVNIFNEAKYGEVENIGDVQNPVIESMPERHVARLAEYATEVMNNFGIKCRFHIKRTRTNIINGLSEELDENNYDLIVMGTNGAEDLNQFYFGTHSFRISKNAPVPVIIVPEEIEVVMPEKIIYATEYERKDIERLHYLLKLTEHFESQITVLHVDKKEKSISDNLFGSLETLISSEVNSDRITYAQAVTEDVADGIENYYINGNYQLLVLHSRNESLIDRIFRKSITRFLTSEAHFPILVL